MSSTTGLSRIRSIRKPAGKDNESAPSKPVQSRNEPRNVSPSRLPMKPPTTTSRTRAPSGLTSRQTSGGSSTKVSSRLAEHGAPAAARPLGRAPSVRQAPSTTTATTATSSSAIGRSGSIARPKSSGGISSTTALRERHMGHSRAKSTVTSLTAATTLRPLSHAPSRSNPSPAPSTASSTSTTTQTTTTSSTRAQTRPQTRSQTQHARVPSQSKSSTANPTANLAARRPVFNTNQQHYSPAKSLAPKPLTATFLAPPSPSKQPVNVAITAETSRLQTELLQLSLLHREAHAVSASWHASARSKLGARFKELAAADRALRAVEREAAEARGLQDLILWASAPPEPSSSPSSSSDEKRGRGGARTKARNSDVQGRLPLDEKVQLLDQVLNGAWALGEPGGRYQRAVRAFEEWARLVAEIRTAQRGGDIDGLLIAGSGSDAAEEGEIGIFVSDLDASAWRRDHAGLVRVLEGWRRTLALLGTVDDDDDYDDNRGGGNDEGGEDAESRAGKPRSGLARTLRGCRGLVDGMLAELRAMERIEADALAAEEEWMALMEARLLADGQDESRTGRNGGVPPWKSLLL